MIATMVRRADDPIAKFMRWLEDSRPHAWGQRRRQALGMTKVIYEKRKLEQVNDAMDIKP
jgi:hypothetical protein